MRLWNMESKWSYEYTTSIWRIYAGRVYLHCVFKQATVQSSDLYAYGRLQILLSLYPTAVDSGDASET